MDLKKLGSNDGFEERKGEGSDGWQTLTTSNSIDMEAEQVGPSTLPSLTNSKNLNLNSGQDGTLVRQPVRNSKKKKK